MKIVIVDDDILVSSALKTILEAGGEVEVTYFSSCFQDCL